MTYIKNIVKFLFVFFINIFKTVKWLWIQFNTENFKNYIKKNKYINNEILILANGPSLLKDLEKFKNLDNKELCVVNNFSISSIFTKLKPTIYVLTDPSYFTNDIRLQVDVDALEALKKVFWKIDLYIPFNAYKMLKKRNDNIFLNTNINIIPFHVNEYDGFDKINYFLSIHSLTMPKPQNVLIPCIFNSINLNFKKIYLLGVDHTWTEKICVDNHNRVCFRNEHFYDNREPEYIPFLDIYGKQYNMHQILYDFSLMFKGYSKLNMYARMRNVEILNCTDSSFIDSFDRL